VIPGLVTLPLADRVALVTGGSRGIGRAIALRLAQAGARVAIAYRSRDAEATSLLAELRALGREAHAERLDVADFAATQAFAEGVRTRFGDVDVLVNNAGVVVDRPLFAMSEADWDVVLDTNLKGAFNLSRAVLGRMMRRGSGRIVNIASVSGLRGVPGQANYAASKAGLVGLTRALAAESARFGVTVNAVAPGFIDTEMLRSMPDDKRSDLTKHIPMARLGSEQDVAEAVLYLVSDAAAYVTGAVLPVDGGLLL
jgi:3-oxoacyl-[acyl-carrier protein] reductase